MWPSDPDLANASDSSSTTSSISPPPARLRRRNRRRRGQKHTAAAEMPAQDAQAEAPEAEDVWRGAQWEAARPRHPKPVLLAAEDPGDGGVGRSRSLTDDDLEELKGCADLGFGFSYDEIPELRGTLPALELCYSMSRQRLLDDHPAPEAAADTAAPPAPPVTNWKISSPGDSPDEVKARLKYWAQAVACTVRLCS